MQTEPMRQGELWMAASSLFGQERRVVLLDADAVVQQNPLLVVALVHPDYEVPAAHRLLSVPIPGTPHVIALYDITIYRRTSLVTFEGAIGGETLEQVKVGMRARFDL